MSELSVKNSVIEELSQVIRELEFCKYEDTIPPVVRSLILLELEKQRDKLRKEVAELEKGE